MSGLSLGVLPVNNESDPQRVADLTFQITMAICVVFIAAVVTFIL